MCLISAACWENVEPGGRSDFWGYHANDIGLRTADFAPEPSRDINLVTTAPRALLIP